MSSLRLHHPDAPVYFFAFNRIGEEWKQVCNEYRVVYIPIRSYRFFVSQCTARSHFWECYPEVGKWLLFSEIVTLDYDYFFYIDLDVYFFDRVESLIKKESNKLGAIQFYRQPYYTPCISKNRWDYVLKKIFSFSKNFSHRNTHSFCTGFMYFSHAFVALFLKSFIKIYIDYVWRLVTFSVVHEKKYPLFLPAIWLKNNQNRELSPWDRKRKIYIPWKNPRCAEEIAFSLLAYKYFKGQIESISQNAVSIMQGSVTSHQVAVHYFTYHTDLFFDRLPLYHRQKNGIKQKDKESVLL